MDSGLEECILPSIRRSQILLIYRKGGVDNPETCCQVACAVEVIRRMETRGQDPCEVGRPRKNKTLGQIACSVEVIRRMETLWSGPLRGRETSHEQVHGWLHFRADTGVCPYDSYCLQLPRCKVTSPAYVHSVDDPYFVLAGLPTERGS